MKKRNFKSKEYYEEIINEYFIGNRFVFLKKLLNKLNFDSMQDLHNYEYYMGFGYDCGMVSIVPTDKSMLREWELDNGKYNTNLYVSFPYPTQSTTIKKAMCEILLNGLGIANEFTIKTSLD